MSFLRNPLLEEEDYEALLRALEWAESFSLFFAVCTPVQADALIEQLGADLQALKVNTLILSEPVDNLYNILNDSAEYSQSNVLFIQGVEKSLTDYIKPGYGGQGDYYKQDSVPRLLGHLNLQRERFQNTFPNIRFVFLLPKFALRYFILRAPDFFDWHSGVFEFSTEQGILEQASRQILEEQDNTYVKLTHSERHA
ncbi:MAG: hypothetical protein GY862_11205, partial [Gammaproteobacteria bacterium]|nr:hypothetical protein [Gammaproteobacteria bacterium]